MPKGHDSSDLARGLALAQLKAEQDDATAARYYRRVMDVAETGRLLLLMRDGTIAVFQQVFRGSHLEYYALPKED